MASCAADNLRLRTAGGDDLLPGCCSHQWPGILPGEELVDRTSICILALRRSLRSAGEQLRRNGRPAPAHEAVCRFREMEVCRDQADRQPAGKSDRIQ